MDEQPATLVRVGYVEIDGDRMWLLEDFSWQGRDQELVAILADVLNDSDLFDPARGFLPYKEALELAASVAHGKAVLTINDAQWRALVIRIEGVDPESEDEDDEEVRVW